MTAVYAWLAGFVGLGSLITVCVFLAKESAKAEERLRQDEASVERARNAQKTAEDVRRLPDTALDDELRRHQRG